MLCPRADSEIVCETALELLRAAARPDPAVLDLCAGTGCLGLGVKRFYPGARVTCVENSPAALGYLYRNAAGALPGAAVDVCEADVLAAWRAWPAGSADLILSNPPYLTAAEMAALQPETAREPACALDGGPDGLAFYRCLTGPVAARAAPGRLACFGDRLRPAAGRARAWAAKRLGQRRCRRDYGGNDRVIALQKPE